MNNDLLVLPRLALLAIVMMFVIYVIAMCGCTASPEHMPPDHWMKIRINIVDSDNQPVVGADVRLESPGPASDQPMACNNQGEYETICRIGRYATFYVHQYQGVSRRWSFTNVEILGDRVMVVLRENQ